MSAYKTDEIVSCTSFGTEQTALLSVSVTFNKAQENFKIDENSVIKKSEKSQGEDDCVGNIKSFREGKSSVCNNERNTSTSLKLNSDSKVKAEVTTKSEQVKNTEILLGWKGYSNNIYIQPIMIVNPPLTNHENIHCSKSRKFTLEDMEKQLRLRQASEWVVKYNQRIQLKGSLRISPSVQKVRPGTSNGSISRRQSSCIATIPEKICTFYGPLPRHKQTSKLAKGFVCKQWARDFLLKDNETQKVEEDGPTPLMVRSYHNVTMMQLPIWNSKKTLKDEKIVCPNIGERQPGNTIIENAQNLDDELKGHQVSRNLISSLSSSSFKYTDMRHRSNELLPRENPQEDLTDLTVFRDISVSVRNSCSNDSSTCRSNENAEPRAIESGKTNYGKQKSKARNMSKSRHERTIFTPVPLKEFPPIDPLGKSRISSKIPTVGKSKLTPRRPHSVYTTFSFNSICGNNRPETTRISSSRSLDSHFRGIHGKGVKPSASIN